MDSSSRFRVQQLDHVEVFVPDLYEAADWYASIFGLEIMREVEHWAQHGTGPLFLTSDGGSTKLALFKGEPAGFRKPVGFQRVAFRVDADGFFRFLRNIEANPVFDNEGEPTTELELMDYEIAYSVLFCDPYGNRYEVCTYDHDTVSRQLEAASR
jgi:catechol 2,3-dioxygenase-like lactoylglutathione lyase family enzyme